MAINAVDALSRVPLLAGLGRPDLERVAAQLGEHTFDPGSAITVKAARGPRVLAFFIIASGRASVTVDGEEQALLHPGDYFGEVALLYDVPRTATVRAETPLRCWTMSAWEFRQFVQAHPQVAWTLLENLARRLPNQLP
jgi:CRP-like cAMP-binding protein